MCMACTSWPGRCGAQQRAGRLQYVSSWLAADSHQAAVLFGSLGVADPPPRTAAI
eukprot:COSAG06_NODE_31634_length_518_cov_0.859189_1_plen_54_part_10